MKIKNGQIEELEKVLSERSLLDSDNKEDENGFRNIYSPRNLKIEDVLKEKEELKERLISVEDNFEEKKVKYKVKIEQLEKELVLGKDHKEGYKDSLTNIPAKRKESSFNLEDELREKDDYIKRLESRLEEFERENQNNIYKIRKSLNT